MVGSFDFAMEPENTETKDQVMNVAISSGGSSTTSCLQCWQNFGEIDTYAPVEMGVTLRCSKYKFNAKTQKRDLPAGCECYPCEAWFDCKKTKH